MFFLHRQWSKVFFLLQQEIKVNIVCDFQVKVDSEYNLLEYADHGNTWLWLALYCSDKEQQVKIGVEVCFNGVRHELQMFRLVYGALTDGQGGVAVGRSSASASDSGGGGEGSCGGPQGFLAV